MFVTHRRPGPGKVLSAQDAARPVRGRDRTRRTLNGSVPVGVKILVLDGDYEPQPLPWDALEPADLPRLISSLPAD